jgi:Ca2+-dependent lipid-binding protein
MAGFIDPNLNQGSYGAPSNMMPRVSSMPTTTVDLTFKCSKLKDLDYISKSDPVAVIFDKINNTWREIWRSERLENNLNPIWKNKLTFDYRFEECQPIKVEIYDWDTNDKSAKGKLKDQEFIGSCETTLAAIASAPQKMFKAVLRSKSNKGAGTLSILAEEVTANKEVVSLHFAAKDLDKKDTFGKSDAFMIISMSLPVASGQANWSKVLQTKVVKNSLNPSWDSFNISLKNLCNGDYERSLKFDVYDYDSSGDNDLIGSVPNIVKTFLSVFLIELFFTHRFLYHHLLQVEGWHD